MVLEPMSFLTGVNISETIKMAKSIKNIQKYFKRNGKGVYTTNNGDKYEGEFLDGQ